MADNMIEEFQRQIEKAYHFEEFQAQIEEWARASVAKTFSDESRERVSEWLQKTLNSCWQCDAPIPWYLKTSGAEPQFCIKCLCEEETYPIETLWDGIDDDGR